MSPIASAPLKPAHSGSRGCPTSWRPPPQRGDPLLELFSRLAHPSDAPDSIATTVWTPHGPARAFKVLAWSEGPAENVSADLLNRAPAFAVVPGVGGLRLIYVHPVVKGDSRVAVAASETVISTPLASSSLPPIYTVDTAMGHLPVTPVTSATTSSTRPPDFTIADRTGALLLQVTVPLAQLADAQRLAHWRAASLALLPWLVWLAVVAAATLHRRAPRAGLRVWFLQSLLGAALIALVAVVAVWLIRRVGLPDVWVHLARALAALAIVAAIPGSAWWLRLRRPSTAHARPRAGRPSISLAALFWRLVWSGWRGFGAIASIRPPWRSGSCLFSRLTWCLSLQSPRCCWRRSPSRGPSAACSACSRRAGACTGAADWGGWPCCCGWRRWP